MRVKDKNEKADWNSTLQKLKSWHPVPSRHGKYKGKSREMRGCFVFFFLSLKSLQGVTAAMKLEDVCSLEEKLWQT